MYARPAKAPTPSGFPRRRSAESYPHAGSHPSPCERDAREECWHVYYGDVRVGMIAIRTGNPDSTDPWQWHCGFYPGSHSRTLGGYFPQSGPMRMFRHGVIIESGPPRSITASIEASPWPVIGTLVVESGAGCHSRRAN